MLVLAEDNMMKKYLDRPERCFDYLWLLQFFFIASMSLFLCLVCLYGSFNIDYIIFVAIKPADIYRIPVLCFMSLAFLAIDVMMFFISVFYWNKTICEWKKLRDKK